MSERLDIQNVLSQMRTMKLQASGMTGADAGPGAVNGASPAADRADVTRIGQSSETRSFSELMGNALDTVNQLQQESGRLTSAIERGEEGVSLTQAMVASQKASVAFQAVTEARNKLVNAYEKIMNMPV